MSAYQAIPPVSTKSTLFTDVLLRVLIISAMIGSWVGVIFGVVKLSGVVS